MSLMLCVRLWAVPGNEGLLATDEDEVLSLLGDHHGARVLQRVPTWPIPAAWRPDRSAIVRSPRTEITGVTQV